MNLREDRVGQIPTLLKTPSRSLDRGQSPTMGSVVGRGGDSALPIREGQGVVRRRGQNL